MVFVRARMSAGEYLDDEDSMFWDHVYCGFFQSTTYRSAAADLVHETVENAS